MVALDMIQTHQHTKSWALEVVLITDGESGFRQDEYEDAMTRLDELGVKLTVVYVLGGVALISVELALHQAMILLTSQSREIK